MLDMNRIDELREDFGEDDFEEIISLFLEEVEQRLAEITEQSCADVAGVLHFLKGSAANLGFTSFKSACEQAEEGLSSDDLKRIAEVYAQSKDVFFKSLESRQMVA